MRQFVDKNDVIRYPPVGNLAFEIGQHVILADVLAFRSHDDEQGTLGPFRMSNAYDSCLRNGFMTHRRVLELD